MDYFHAFGDAQLNLELVEKQHFFISTHLLFQRKVRIFCLVTYTIEGYFVIYSLQLQASTFSSFEKNVPCVLTLKYTVSWVWILRDVLSTQRTNWLEVVHQKAIVLIHKPLAVKDAI